MTDQDTLAAIQQQLAQLTQPPTPGAAGGWQKPAATGVDGLHGVAVPVKLDGVRCYFWFGAEHAASPEALRRLLGQLEELGLPLERWRERSGWNGGRGASRGWDSGGRGRWRD